MPRNPLVMIIDENAPFRQEVQAMLTPARLAVVAESGYGVEAASLAEDTKPDLILASVEDPTARAIQTIEAVRGILPDVPVIAYSSTTDFGVVRQVMHAGVRDLLAQPLKAGELLAAIELAMRGVDAQSEKIANPNGQGTRLSSAGTVLTVFGAKGGIGKTTITTNVATAIAKNTDSSVLIIDLDTRFGDVAIMMDIDPRYTVAQLAANVSTLDRETFKSALVQHESGVYVLPSPKHPNEWRSVQADEIKELVRFSARMFDYVILDTPGAFNDIVGTAIECATQVLVVTSVDMASIKDTSFILDLLESESFPEERLLLTVNHANGANTIRASDIERVLRKKVYWEIPHDNEVTLATQVGKPVVLAKPRSRASQNITALAMKITGKAPERKTESRSLFKRLVPASSRSNN
ncbi:MAG: P-loop NTPase [Dehalococcoidia bacterium]